MVRTVPSPKVSNNRKTTHLDSSLLELVCTSRVTLPFGNYHFQNSDQSVHQNKVRIFKKKRWDMFSVRDKIVMGTGDEAGI